MSPNNYYNENFSGFDGGRASARQVERMGQNVEAAFDRLPEERTLKENRVNYAVATAISGQAFAVTLPHPITQYVDGMFIPVKMPRANGGPSTIDVDGVGAKEIRDIQGNALLVDQWAANAIVGLRYTDEGTGRFILQGGGVRGETGPQGPPDGRFSLNASKELLFSPTDGSAATNLGPAAPFWRGVYSSSTAYPFLSIVRSGSFLYLHVGTATTTGTALTDTTVWQKLAPPGADGGLVMEFRTATSQADPGNGRMRFNHASPASVTQIYVDDQDVDGNALGAWVDTWDDNGAQLVVKGVEGAETLVFNLTSVVALSGYRRLSVTHVAGTSLPGNGDLVSVIPLLKGAPGTDGNDGEKGSIFVPASGVAQSGTGNATIALTPNPAATGYSPGDTYEFVIESDISADAVINVSGQGNKHFSFSAAARISSLKAGFVARAVYDGTRFLLGSLVAAVLTAGAVEFTASNPAYAWPYAAPMALAVIDGAGGGGGGGAARGGGGGGGGAGDRKVVLISGLSVGDSFSIVVGEGGSGGARSTTSNDATGGAGGAGGGGEGSTISTGSGESSEGGNGGGNSSVAVNGQTFIAAGGSGGGGGAYVAQFGNATPGGYGGTKNANGINRYGQSHQAVYAGEQPRGGSGGGGAGGRAISSGGNNGNHGADSAAGTGGPGGVAASSNSAVNGGTASGGAGGDRAQNGGNGGGGRVTLYPIWA